MTNRLCFVLDLKDVPGAIEEYERLHAVGGVWPVVIQDIRDSGFFGMEIWRSGNRLVMVVDVALNYPRPRLDDSVERVVAAWEELVGKLQQPLSTTQEKWAAMTKIFDLAQHDGATVDQ